MLERLEFKHLGPSPAMEPRLGERLNLLTGDNGLGKPFVFERKGVGRVAVEVVPWAKFGDASGWLTSPAFDMDSGYSREAETAMKAADDLMAGAVWLAAHPDKGPHEKSGWWSEFVPELARHFNCRCGWLAT